MKMFPLATINVPLTGENHQPGVVFQRQMANAIPAGFAGVRTVIAPQSSGLNLQGSGVPQVSMNYALVQVHPQQDFVRANATRIATYAHDPAALEYVQAGAIQEPHSFENVVSTQQEVVYQNLLKQGSSFGHHGNQIDMGVGVAQLSASSWTPPQATPIQHQHCGDQQLVLSHMIEDSWPRATMTSMSPDLTVPAFWCQLFSNPERQLSAQMLEPLALRVTVTPFSSSSHHLYQQPTYQRAVPLTATIASRLSHEERYRIQSRNVADDSHHHSGSISFKRQNCDSSRSELSTSASRSKSTSLSHSKSMSSLISSSMAPASNEDNAFKRHRSSMAETTASGDILEDGNTLAQSVGISSFSGSSGLDGERRLKIKFDQYGTKGKYPQTFGRNGYFIPNGLKGSHRMYHQEWIFGITHEHIDLDDNIEGTPEANGKVTVVKWFIKNISSENAVCMIETCAQALWRKSTGNTICNFVLRKALEQRIDELEKQIVEEDMTDLQKANVRNLIKGLNFKGCVQGILFFGLRHEIVQHVMKHNPATSQVAPNSFS